MDKQRLTIRPSDQLTHGRKSPTTKKRLPVPHSQTSKNTINRYEALIESSNSHHKAVYDYIEANEADEMFQVHVQGMYHWLKLIAQKNGFVIE